MLKPLCFNLLLSTSKLVNKLLKFLLRWSFHSGNQQEKEQCRLNFDTSAHRLRVLYRNKPFSVGSPGMNNFFLTHIEYGDPISSIIKNSRVSLMNVDEKQAIFAVSPKNFNIYDSKHGPFFYNVQYSNCEEVITLPINFLKPLADKALLSQQSKNDVNNKTVVILWSTGRCGSTLLTKMLVAVSKNDVATISEPDALINVRGGDFNTRANNLAAIITLQCNEFFVNNISTSILKPRSTALRILREVDVGSPGTKHVFMYRNPLSVITSFSNIFEPIPSYLRKGFFRHMSNLEILSNITATDINQKLMESKLNKSIEDDDIVEFCTLYFIIHITWVLFGRKRHGIDIFVVKYENLIQDPIKQLDGIFQFCGRDDLSEEDLEKCNETLKTDSQKGSSMSRGTIDDPNKKKTLEETFKSLNMDKISNTLEAFGFPCLDDFDKVFDGFACATF